MGAGLRTKAEEDDPGWSVRGWRWIQTVVVLGVSLVVVHGATGIARCVDRVMPGHDWTERLLERMLRRTERWCV